MKEFEERLEHLDSGLNPVTVGSVEQLIKKLCAEHGVPLPILAKPLRYALTGQVNSPSVFALVALLGRDEVVRRVKLLRSIAV